jgi:hypothetical protein
MPSPLPVGMPPLPRCSNTTIPEGCRPYSCLEGSHQDAVGGKSHTNVAVFAHGEKLPSPRGISLPLERMPPPLPPNPSTVVPTQTPLPSPDSTTLAWPMSSPWRSFPCPGEGGRKHLGEGAPTIHGASRQMSAIPDPKHRGTPPLAGAPTKSVARTKREGALRKKWYCLFLWIVRKLMCVLYHGRLFYR